MSVRIYKYPLDFDTQVIEMHSFRRIVHVDNQHNRPAIWAEVDTDSPLEQVTFHVVATGSEVPSPGEYRWTVLFDEGKFVFHVYEDSVPWFNINDDKKS